MLNLEVCEMCFVENRPMDYTEDYASELFQKYVENNICVCVNWCTKIEDQCFNSSSNSSYYPGYTSSYHTLSANGMSLSGCSSGASISAGFPMSGDEFQQAICSQYVFKIPVPHHCKYFMEQTLWVSCQKKE